MHPEYLTFMEQIKAHPEKEHIPSPLVDKIWHEHILDTKAYSKFCNEFFGTYLHHTPGNGYCAGGLGG